MPSKAFGPVSALRWGASGKPMSTESLDLVRFDAVQRNAIT